MTRLSSSKIVAGALTIVFAYIGLHLFAGSRSADLLAGWIAGANYSAGLFDQIYPGYADGFTLHPHPAWPDMIGQTEYRGPVFPFIYAPIWAWAMSHIPSYEAFRVFAFFVLITNLLLMSAMVWLAMRITRSTMPPVLYVSLGALLFAMTTAGNIALVEGQIQILVSVLILLAIERTQSGRQTAAGLALALAAAIKVYPALFALLWLASRDWRAFFSFVGFGFLLGVISIVVAGWPLHAAFLHELAAISNSVLVTGLSPNIQSIIAQTLYANDLQLALAVEVNMGDQPTGGWRYLVMSPVFAAASKAALMALLIAGMWWASRASLDIRSRHMWPILVTATALITPISWSYYFLPGLAFLPALAWQFGPRWGTLALLTVFMPTTVAVVGALFDVQPQIVAFPYLALLAFQVMAAWRDTKEATDLTTPQITQPHSTVGARP